jgi:hypothetical protein
MTSLTLAEIAREVVLSLCRQTMHLPNVQILNKFSEISILSPRLSCLTAESILVESQSFELVSRPDAINITRRPQYNAKISTSYPGANFLR